jgi:sulfate permease, SulP family
MSAWLFISLRGYRIEWLPRDLIAGLMLAAIAIPGQLATARLAGMPPQTGLYACAAGSLAFGSMQSCGVHYAANATTSSPFVGWKRG